MAKVQCSRICLAYGDRDILKDVNLNLASGEGSGRGSRAALAGINGSGKTTLMKILAGLLKPDSGELAIQKNCRVSYLPQAGMAVLKHTEKTSLWEEVESAFANIRELLGSMEELGRTLEGAKTDDSSTAATLNEYHRLEETVEASGYYRREADMAQVLAGLGFSEADYARPLAEFSGGWQMRAALAKVLLENPAIMLLDEPTNYLDIEARTWLEAWLEDFPGGVLLVSHDRYFLDVCVNEVYELFQGSLKRYAGNYSSYEEVRRGELESLLKRYTAQQEEIARSEALIQRFRYKATKAAMVQERIKKLEKMERIEIPESLKKISITFPPPPHSGRTALTLEQVEKHYGGRRVLAGLDCVIEAGEKLVVVGKNGAGKTTLLRIAAGADSGYSGSIRYGSGVIPGYFCEDVGLGSSQPDLKGGETVLEFMEKTAPTALVPKVRDMLGAFLFRGDDVYKSIDVLSGGEKSRLALLRLLLRPVNLLILDEPTNHLDIHSKDVLLDALSKFSGTVLFVSHDRAFMEALSTKTLELRPPDSSPEPGLPAARLFYGGYGYYLERLEREAADGVLSMRPPAASPPVPGGGTDSRDLAKQRQALIRRLERQEGEILANLEKLEAEKARLEEELSCPEVYSNGDRSRTVKTDLDRTAAALEETTARWEAAAAELEAARHKMIP